MNTIHAIYADGIFRPKGPVDLPEQCEVEFEPRVVERKTEVPESVYDVLSRRFASGEPDVAERHDEHQP